MLHNILCSKQCSPDKIIRDAGQTNQAPVVWVEKKNTSDKYNKTTIE